MCGIAGWLGPMLDGTVVADRVLCRLRHRGPDAQGSKQWTGAALLHTRLSILDLSRFGMQPMANEDGSVWTVFNGEIYNHRELRAALEGRGHVFRGRSDTEVLPHLYEENGPELFARLRGMFAIAIYDARANTLLLGRDRFGIKPLFYAPGRERLSFASEIPALRAMPGIDDRPSAQAISDFAALYYVPAPDTLYVGIRALEPGQWLEARWDAGRVSVKTRSFHVWSIKLEPKLALAEAAHHAERLVNVAVRRQMESDVPMGSLLSGGIDSSLVSIAAQRSTNGGIRTFNVRFPERTYDETWAAQAVADHIGSRHETLDMQQVCGTWEHVTGLLQHAGQPFADTSVFAMHAVSRLMRSRVTVALSGDGGDEGFGGYDFYWQIARVARLQRLPRPFWHVAAAALAPAAYSGMIRGSLPQRVRDLTGADNVSIIQGLLSSLPAPHHGALIVDSHVLPVRRFFEPQWVNELPRDATRLERLSAHLTELLLRLTLPNDFLFKVDMASMRESLEVRVPMLDEDLVAFGLTLPHRLKVEGHTCKLVLRSIASRALPRAVAAKPKMGFAIPVDAWMNAECKRLIKETVLHQSSPVAQFFRRSTYTPWVEAFCDGRPYPRLHRAALYRCAIMLLALHVSLSPVTRHA